MSSRKNHRRGHPRRQDNGPRWESATPSGGCNSTHVARARTSWGRLHERKLRRTGKTASFGPYTGAELPPIEDGSEE